MWPANWSHPVFIGISGDQIEQFGSQASDWRRPIVRPLLPE
jgi:hypothetical protein